MQNLAAGTGIPHHDPSYICGKTEKKRRSVKKMAPVQCRGLLLLFNDIQTDILFLWGRSVSTDRGRGYLQAERFTLRTKKPELTTQQNWPRHSGPEPTASCTGSALPDTRISSVFHITRPERMTQPFSFRREKVRKTIRTSL